MLSDAVGCCRMVWDGVGCCLLSSVAYDLRQLVAETSTFIRNSLWLTTYSRPRLYYICLYYMIVIDCHRLWNLRFSTLLAHKAPKAKNFKKNVPDSISRTRMTREQFCGSIVSNSIQIKAKPQGDGDAKRDSLWDCSHSQSHRHQNHVEPGLTIRHPRQSSAKLKWI